MFSLLLDIYTQEWDCTVTWRLYASLCESLSNCFALVVAPLYIPTGRVQGFPFLYILSNPCYFLIITIFIFAILAGMTWYLTVILMCISLMTNAIEGPFVRLLVVGETSIQAFCLFLNGVICLFGVDLYIYSGYEALISYMICKYLLQAFDARLILFTPPFEILQHYWKKSWVVCNCIFPKRKYINSKHQNQRENGSLKLWSQG